MSSRDWNYIVDLVMWPKFDGFDQQYSSILFEEYCWLKFNNLALDMAKVKLEYLNDTNMLWMAVSEIRGGICNPVFRQD